MSGTNLAYARSICYERRPQRPSMATSVSSYWYQFPYWHSMHCYCPRLFAVSGTDPGCIRPRLSLRNVRY
eukprot:1820093-Rhodomonas_salina.1